MLSYALITPARNEAENIERTIASVIGQTVLPLTWVIVNDGSTDKTEAIVRRYLPAHPWIKLITRPKREERHFGGKADSFNAGYALLKDLTFDVIGNLDADLSFDADFFEFLLLKLSEDPLLGVAGAPFREDGQQYDYRYTSVEHVSGACQLFRTACFSQIGGYMPIKEGGIDLVAVVTARMKGWRTKTFTEKTYEHHRKTQSGKHSSGGARFKCGYHDYLMGVHPAWMLFRSIYQASKQPYITGGAFLLLGYLYAYVKRTPRPLSREFVAFRQKEQINRLRKQITRIIPLVRSDISPM